MPMILDDVCTATGPRPEAQRLIADRLQAEEMRAFTGALVSDVFLSPPGGVDASAGAMLATLRTVSPGAALATVERARQMVECRYAARDDDRRGVGGLVDQALASLRAVEAAGEAVTDERPLLTAAALLLAALDVQWRARANWERRAGMTPRRED